MRKFKINSNILEVIGSKGKEYYKIASVTPVGVVILAEADNGVEIHKTIKWENIKG